MIRRYQAFKTNRRIELFEVIADSNGTIIPLQKITESSSLGALKENLKNMLTDVETYGLLSMDVAVEVAEEDEDYFVEYSEDVVIEDCYDRFTRN